jgi:hypothetical protein
MHCYDQEGHSSDNLTAVKDEEGDMLYGGHSGLFHCTTMVLGNRRPSTKNFRKGGTVVYWAQQRSGIVGCALSTIPNHSVAELSHLSRILLDIEGSPRVHRVRGHITV